MLTAYPVNAIGKLQRSAIDLPEMVGLNAPKPAADADTNFRRRICWCGDSGSKGIESKRSSRSRISCVAVIGNQERIDKCRCEGVRVAATHGLISEVLSRTRLQQIRAAGVGIRKPMRV